MLKETYIANIRNLPKDAMVIQVTRSKGHPLSPSWELLNNYKSGKVTWDEYTTIFKEQMKNCSLCQDMMRNIKEMSKRKDVYLVCFEKTYPCHRFLLIDIINKME